GVGGEDVRQGTGSPGPLAARRAREEAAGRGDVAAAGIADRIRALAAENAHYQLVLRAADGKDLAIPGADVVRIVPANRLSFWGRLGVYFDRWFEFLTTEPRQQRGRRLARDRRHRADDAADDDVRGAVRRGVA